MTFVQNLINMKNNTHSIRLLPLGALLTITFLVLTAVNYPYKAKSIKHRNQHNESLEHSDFAPITNSEQVLLSNENKMAYWIKDASGAFANPLIINPIVNIDDIYKYYEQNNQGGKYGGIRFYPAFENNTIFLIMCLAEGSTSINDISQTGEILYMKLNKGLLNNQGATSASSAITAAEAKALHNRYLDEVLLYQKSQDTTTTEDTLRYSRLFAWEDFVKLTDQNLNGGNKVEFLFQIEIGYVTEAMATILASRAIDVYTIKQNQGFTTMIHVKDKDGNSLLDPFSKYTDTDPAERNNYLGRTMEVATPCPPRCGINH